jgi:hypothetical protein
LQPSIIAASSNTAGMLRNVCRMMKQGTVMPAENARINPNRLFLRLRNAISSYWAISPPARGTKISITIVKKIRSRPGNVRRAKA